MRCLVANYTTLRVDDRIYSDIYNGSWGVLVFFSAMLSHWNDFFHMCKKKFFQVGSLIFT